MMDEDSIVQAAVSEILEQTADRKSVLVFCAGVRHAMHVASLLPNAEFVLGETPPEVRDSAIQRFRAGTLKYLVNVNVLSIGFDAPNVDAIAMLRPTLSPGLYYQQVGRGFRICPGKEDCLILDFAGNVKEHGPIDRIDPPRKRGGNGMVVKSDEEKSRMCPKCREVLDIYVMVCPECGHKFEKLEKPQVKHDTRPDDAPILSQELPPEWRTVKRTSYYVHTKRGAEEGSPRTMRVEYELGLTEVVKEWICVEHEGYARGKANRWWTNRSADAMPKNAEHAVWLAMNGSLREPAKILVAQDGKYQRVVNAEFEEQIPEPIGTSEEDALMEVPF